MSTARRPARVLSVTAGQRIGRGLVIDPEIRTAFSRAVPKGRRGARLRCDCGNIYEAPLTAITSQTLPSRSRRSPVNTRSCGCLHDENSTLQLRLRNSTHGLVDHPLYWVWKAMLSRCENPKGKSWPNYGARGITVCEQWHDLPSFIAWIEANLGPQPDGLTFDRIDNDGNYEPGNVKWSTYSEQNRNRRSYSPRRSSK